MDHPNHIGDRTTMAVMLALADAGYELYVPFGENTRTDLVVDDGERLRRIQCKTGRLREGAVRFAACSSYAHHPNPRVLRRSYLGEIDAFGVHCPETAGVYLIPIEDAQLRCQCALRVDEPRNNQRRRIRFEDDFLIATISVSRLAGAGGDEATPEAARSRIRS